MKWKDKLISDIKTSLKNDRDWYSVFNNAVNEHNCNIHLAVFNEPFLSMVFEGTKTLESRFSINKVTPYGKVLVNDIILVKKAGGPVVGIFTAKKVSYYSNLNINKIAGLESEFGERIGWDKDSEFFTNKSLARFLTLIELDQVKMIKPIEVNKTDRTAWSIVKVGFKDTLFEIQE